jgi:hypothetical protein
MQVFKSWIGALGAAALGATMMLVGSGCGEADYRPEAIGREGEITVVVDSARWHDAVGDALRDEIGAYIMTLPMPEPSFQINTRTLGRDFEQVQRHKNVVIAAPLSDTTSVAQYLRNRVPEGAEGVIGEQGGAIIPRRDLWRRNQMVVYVMANSAEDLAETIRRRGDDIRYHFNEITRVRTARDMFQRGRQPEIEEQLMEKHGFAINAQHDYFTAIDTTDFVWLRRVLSDTWRSLWVHYIDNASPALLTPEWIYETRDAVTRRWVQGNLGDFVQIDYRLPHETENINFRDRYGYETRGVWYMVGEDENGQLRQQMAMGGPFVNYTFYDEASGRIYMIDGMVFAPEYPKREFLRQMEAIAYTFRTRNEVEATETLTASR